MLSADFFTMHVNILPCKKFGLHVPFAPFNSLFPGAAAQGRSRAWVRRKRLLMSKPMIAVCVLAAVALEAMSLVLACSLAFNVPIEMFPEASASPQQTCLVEEDDGTIEEYRSASIEPTKRRRILTDEEKAYILDPMKRSRTEAEPTLDEVLSQALKTRTAGEAVCRAKEEAARKAEEERIATETEAERKRQQAKQEEIEDDAVPMSDGTRATSPMTISFLGTTNSYIDSYMTASAPKHGAGLWYGSDSTTDGELGYFIGHHPGDFYAVMELSEGDVVSVCDRDGDSRDYAVVDVFTVPDDTYLDDILDRIDRYGESVCLQTCVGDKASFRIAVAQAI